MARRPSTIRHLPFRHSAKPGLGFEIFRLSDLLDRFANHRVDHAPEAERLVEPAAPLPAALQRFFTSLERDHLATRAVGHYARRAGLSPRRLGELIADHTGKSTKQVIDERVILEQKRLLVHTDLSVKELAARTGFAEPTNLVKFFRHHTATTPLAFRAEHRRRILPLGRGS